MTTSISTPQSPATAPLAQDAKTIALVSTAHGLSHFNHLILAPLFPWLKDAFNLTYTELGFLMTVFFVVSGIGQAAAGFVVDKLGPRPVLMYAVAGFFVSSLLLSVAPNYMVLLLGAALAGASNSVFHPVDFAILNNRISGQRLGYAFTAHGLSGNLGWAMATAFLAGIATLIGWRQALQGAAVLALVVWVLLWVGRAHLYVAPTLKQAVHKDVPRENIFKFLALPAVWLCFGFFLLASMSLSGFQTFGATILKDQYGFSQGVASQIVTLYLACGAAGMVLGGWLVTRVPRNDKQIAAAYGFSAVGAAAIAMNLIPAGFALFFVASLGFAYGLAGPSRDMLIKRATPKEATGRVYGVVYSGADVGFSVGPLICGLLVDQGLSVGVFWAIALFQLLAIGCAYSVGRGQK